MPTVIAIDDIIENNTEIPVVIIVYELKSIDFNSLTLLIFTPRTSFWIFQAIRQ